VSRRGQRAADALAALKKGDEPVRRPAGVDRHEDGFVVRNVGSSATAYRCPGCDQQFAGVPHVVAWPEGDEDSRRHWHTPCWNHRARRRPR
jgi:hypothetical protein